MNDYTDAIYYHLLEECSQVLATAEYRMAEHAYDRAEETLLATLTPEQKEQFYRCKDCETALESINLRFMFQKTLHFMRSLFCC